MSDHMSRVHQLARIGVDTLIMNKRFGKIKEEDVQIYGVEDFFIKCLIENADEAFIAFSFLITHDNIGTIVERFLHSPLPDDKQTSRYLPFWFVKCLESHDKLETSQILGAFRCDVPSLVQQCRHVYAHNPLLATDLMIDPKTWSSAQEMVKHVAKCEQDMIDLIAIRLNNEKGLLPSSMFLNIRPLVSHLLLSVLGQTKAKIDNISRVIFDTPNPLVTDWIGVLLNIRPLLEDRHRYERYESMIRLARNEFAALKHPTAAGKPTSFENAIARLRSLADFVPLELISPYILEFETQISLLGDLNNSPGQNESRGRSWFS